MKAEWKSCSICEDKTRLQIGKDAEGIALPLYYLKCKQERGKKRTYREQLPKSKMRRGKSR